MELLVVGLLGQLGVAVAMLVMFVRQEGNPISLRQRTDGRTEQEPVRNDARLPTLLAAFGFFTAVALAGAVEGA